MSSSSNHHSPENFSLTAEDRFVLSNLRVPVPHNEQKRIETLRQSKLLDNAAQETGFHRFTSLATRLFNMPFAAVTFLDVDSVHFKSKIGFDLQEIHRNDWFDAYTILPESSEVYVIADCFTDNRFKDKHFVRGNPKIRFYAGAAIMIENVKIGVLSIMDTQPHKFFSLEDKENLLDLGAAAAQLAKEKLQTALNLSTERANIVVSMMHHLRTPMTSLNFATSLLCNDVQQIKSDNGADLLSHVNSSAIGSTSAALMDKGVIPAPINTGAHPTTTFNLGVNNNNVGERKEEVDPLAPSSVFHAFESSFIEINTALNQLNILVDSSLSLGQAIIKCSSSDLTFSNAQTIDSRNNKFSECNIIEYLTDMFHNHLPVHNNNLEIEWIVDTSELSRGTHVTFPDAVMLIVISTVSHMSAESNSLGFYFSFEQVDEEDFEYPELVNKMIEGNLAIKVFAKDGKAHHIGAGGDMLDSVSTDSDGADLPSKQNFLSIDKILRAINGSSKEYISDITRLKKSSSMDGSSAEYRTIHEFFVPCKILLNHHLSNNHHGSGKVNNNQSTGERKKIRFYRGKGHLSPNGSSGSRVVVTTIDSPRNANSVEEEMKSADGKPESNSCGGGKGDSKGDSNNGTAESKKASEGESGGKVLRALVVEDTVPVQKLLTRWLQNHGCIVTCANNGKIGLDRLTSSTFDIAFIDFLMPVMLGITTMKLFQDWLKSNLSPESAAIAESNKEILIVGMSATALESEQEEAFKYGMHFFCPKPVSLDLLAIILNAKKDCIDNDDAVNKICELTGTNNYDNPDNGDNASGNNEDRTPGMTNLIRTRNPNINEGGGDSNNNGDNNDNDDNKARWTLFRSAKQSTRKIFPNDENGGEA